MNRKGQAAITDALYFLLIVSGLCVLLFVFSANYGRTIVEQAERQYGMEYASSAFKTIFYSSIPRVEGESLESSPSDYLLAAIKEDYADNAELDRTKKVLANNIVGIMEPLADNFDYVFYINVYPLDPFLTDSSQPAGASSIVFLMFSRHVTTLNPNNSVSSEAIMFLCKPQGNEPLKSVNSLLEKVGSVAKSSSMVLLGKLDNRNLGSRTTIPTAGEINLAMWVSTSVPQAEFDELNCAPCWKKEGSDWQLQQGC